jgi:hypothetical protein
MNNIAHTNWNFEKYKGYSLVWVEVWRFLVTQTKSPMEVEDPKLPTEKNGDICGKERTKDTNNNLTRTQCIRCSSFIKKRYKSKYKIKFIFSIIYFKDQQIWHRQKVALNPNAPTFKIYNIFLSQSYVYNYIEVYNCETLLSLLDCQYSFSSVNKIWNSIYVLKLS